MEKVQSKKESMEYVQELKQEIHKLEEKKTNLELQTRIIEDIEKAKFAKIIHLNVGGIKYSTTMDTLTREKETYFCSMFSGKYEVPIDKDGSYFIDRDGKTFDIILNYLRRSELIIKKKSHIIQEVRREAEFYGIRSLMELLCPKDIEFGPNSPDGVLYWIGSSRLTKEWENPAVTGDIKIVTNISQHSHDSVFKLVERKATGEASGSDCSVGAGNWMSIDLGVYIAVRPSSYKLKAPPCDLGDYEFEGSVDGTEWRKLHTNRRIDYDIEKWKTGQDYTFSCFETDIYYRWFRWVSIKGNCLHLSGFELYGSMRVNQELF